MYSRELVDDILRSADIVSVISSYIPVTKKGRSFVALCPFHDDKNPSLQISPEKRIYKCFSCGHGGNAITFVRDYEKISFEAAVRKVAEIIGFHDQRLESEATKIRVDPSKEPLYKAIEELAAYYRYALSTDEGKAARDYLRSRGLDEESVRKFGIGYAPKDGETTIKYLLAKGHSLRAVTGIGVTRLNGKSDANAGRIVFPLSDPEGRVVGFSARKIDKDDPAPKYVNSPETAIFEKGKILYNYHRAFQSARRDGYCYLLEGFMDVIALSRSGLGSAVALMGTGLSSDQVSLLRRLGAEIRISLDGDLPGQEGMMKASRSLTAAGIACSLVDYGDDERDPDDVYQEDGPDALKKKMSNLVSPLAFQLAFYSKKEPVEGEEGRKRVLNSFLPDLAAMKSGVEKEDTIEKLAKATGYEPNTVRLAVDAYRKKKAKASQGEVGGSETPRMSRLPEAKTRLQKAERQALYYMMKEREAIKIFLLSIDTFYDRVLNDIANYVVQYDESRESPVELDLLLGDIDSGPSEDKLLLEDEASLIYNERGIPPYTSERMMECATAISEERSELSKRRKARKEMEGKSPEEKAEVITRLAQERARKLGFPTTKKDD